MTGKKQPLIIPYLIEPNGRVERFLEVARNPRIKREYEELLNELKANPKSFGKKLRKATWSGKTLDDIVRELEAERAR